MYNVHPTVSVACLQLSFVVVVIVLLCVNASVQLPVLLLEYSCCCTSEELPFLLSVQLSVIIAIRSVLHSFGCITTGFCFSVQPGG